MMIGWREWVALPELGVDWVKAKTDTGARSSSLHASEIEHFERNGEQWVRFMAHPWQGNDSVTVATEAPLHDQRTIRSSSGETDDRPVIRTMVKVGDREWEIDLTLATRSDMGFRMLLGREALRGSIIVDPGKSYLTGRPSAEIRKLNREQADDDE